MQANLRMGRLRISAKISESGLRRGGVVDWLVLVKSTRKDEQWACSVQIWISFSLVSEQKLLCEGRYGKHSYRGGGAPA